MGKEGLDKHPTVIGRCPSEASLDVDLQSTAKLCYFKMSGCFLKETRSQIILWTENVPLTAAECCRVQLADLFVAHLLFSFLDDLIKGCLGCSMFPTSTSPEVTLVSSFLRDFLFQQATPEPQQCYYPSIALWLQMMFEHYQISCSGPPAASATF